ncbi:MAG: HemK2/MTQ2 family protein methyltransferase [Haloplanus sp.]
MTDDASDSRDRLAERRGLNTRYYDPAEDSALLATAAEDVVEGDWHVLEVGVGSGYVAERVRAETGANVVGSDVNPHACRRARERGVRTVRADIVSPFAAEAFDAVLFNPPYLPTPEAAEWDDWTERALSGGKSGRDVVEPFVRTVGRVLAPGGVVLLLVSSLTGIEAVEGLAADAGFDAETVAESSFPGERLVVLALRR